MNIRKRIEQEIAELKEAYVNEIVESPELPAYQKVLGWMDEAKQARKPRFVKPELDDLILAFHLKRLSEAEATIEAQAFLDYYESCGWAIGGNGKKMVSWKHAVSTWLRNKKSDKNFKTMDNDQLYAEAKKLGIRTAGKSSFDLRAALVAVG